jgi:hypothetical protein
LADEIKSELNRSNAVALPGGRTDMARIRAALPPELLSQLRKGAAPDESVEESVRGGIQATLSTAEVTYSEESAEVTVEIPDDEMISILLGIAIYEREASPLQGSAVKPDSVEATDARLGISSDRSPAIP